MAALAQAAEPGGLKPEHHGAIVGLAERGWSCSRIAQRLALHQASVSRFMYQQGLRRLTPKPGGQACMRNGVPVRRYGADEDAYIQALRREDRSLTEIARLATARFGHRRTAGSIGTRLIMLASIEEAQ